MKVSNVKLLNSVLFDGGQVTFLDTTRNKVEMDFDSKTSMLTIMNSKDFILVPSSNVLYMKVDK